MLPLVVRQGHGPDPSITARIGKELLEVVHLPHHDHTVVASCEQVLPIPAQLDGLGDKGTLKRDVAIGKLRLYLINYYRMAAPGVQGEAVCAPERFLGNPESEETSANFLNQVDRVKLCLTLILPF